jgi:hypothetical protein
VSAPAPETPAYYVPAGPSTFRPSIHTQGAWAPDQQHMGPVSGLLVHAVESCSERDDLALARVSFDILGVIPLTDVTPTAEVVRPGRTVELVEASLTAAGRVVVRARAWRLVRSDTAAIAAGAEAAMPGPGRAEPWNGSEVWSGGFIASLEMRVVPGRVPGKGQVWIRPRVPLLETVDLGVLPRFFGAFDTMNGVAVRVDPSEVTFPNTDLTVHLFRHPVGEWLGLDVSVAFGPEGIGTTAAVLNDEQGPFGRALQILTVRPLRHRSGAR